MLPLSMKFHRLAVVSNHQCLISAILTFQHAKNPNLIHCPNRMALVSQSDFELKIRV